MFVVNLHSTCCFLILLGSLLLSDCRKQGALKSQKLFTSWSVTCALLVGMGLNTTYLVRWLWSINVYFPSGMFSGPVL
jgi:hypothetical protein